MLKSNEFDHNKLPKTFYHGTTAEHVQSILKSIDVTKGQEFVDYGKGFYVTSNYDQAYQQAIKKADITPYKPVIIKLKLNRYRLFKDYNGLIFDTKNEEWANFIYMNRSNEIKNTFDYDFVFGPVADGKIFTLVKLLDDDEIDLNAFLKQISKYNSYNQLSIHNQDIITYNVLSDVKVVK